MNIAFLSSSISRNNGGVTEVKRRLSQILASAYNIDIQIFGLNDDNTQKDFDSWSPLKPNVYKPFGPPALAFAPDILSALRRSNVDLIHLHGLWQYPSYVALKSRKPYVTTIHGMLEQWAIKNSGFKKRIASVLYEKSALQNAKCLQAFTIQEYEDIRHFGLRNPVCIIPNGVDMPLNIDFARHHEPIWKNHISNKKVLLYLGRIHPKKGLTNLINSWKRLAITNPKISNDWCLAIAGWSQGNYETELKRLTVSLGIDKDVIFLGPQFNSSKELAFSHAQAFVLPSVSEGLPMAVLEAWSYGLPVLMTKECNLNEGFSVGAAIQIESSVESIAVGMEKLLSSSDVELMAMGERGKRLVEEKFSWESVGEKVYQMYKWLLHKTEPPSNVIFD